MVNAPTARTLRRRILGTELRGLRERLQLGIEEVATPLGWSTSKISRIETAQNAITGADLAVLLDLYRLMGDQRRRIELLAEQADEEGWWEAFADIVSRDYATYLELEASATSFQQLAIAHVPALLETAHYARAIVEDNPRGYTPEEIDHRVELRLQRQANAFDRRLPYHAVIDEAALHREIGGRSVMAGQLQRVADLVTAYPNVTVQVIPFAAGAYDAMTAAYGVFTFADFPSIAYVETGVGFLWWEREREVQESTARFARLASAALPPDESLDLIIRRAAMLAKG